MSAVTYGVPTGQICYFRPSDHTRQEVKVEINCASTMTWEGEQCVHCAFLASHWGTWLPISRLYFRDPGGAKVPLSMLMYPMFDDQPSLPLDERDPMPQ